MMAMAMEAIDEALRGQGAYSTQFVAYHNNGSHLHTPDYFAKLLRSVSNHVAAVPDTSMIVVVNHAMGMDLLRKSVNADRPELLSMVDDLRTLGVRFVACRNTLREREIDPTDLHGVMADDFVRSGVAHLAHLQAQGYVYLHI